MTRAAFSGLSRACTAGYTSAPPVARDCARPQAVFFQTPHQELDAVLSKKGFALKHHGGYAPVTSLFQGLLVLLDGGIEFRLTSHDRRIEFGEVEARTPGCVREMDAFVPTRHASTPDQP